jgi:hypothetical protein
MMHAPTRPQQRRTVLQTQPMREPTQQPHETMPKPTLPTVLRTQPMREPMLGSMQRTVLQTLLAAWARRLVTT